MIETPRADLGFCFFPGQGRHFVSRSPFSVSLSDFANPLDLSFSRRSPVGLRIPWLFGFGRRSRITDHGESSDMMLCLRSVGMVRSWSGMVLAWYGRSTLDHYQWLTSECKASCVWLLLTVFLALSC